MLKKLKAAATLITLLAVLFTGAMLITASPVQAGGCSEKKESKSCDKSQDKEQKKDQDQDQDQDKDQGDKEEGESESKDEDKGCDKAEE
jgi:hypothetical protein